MAAPSHLQHELSTSTSVAANTIQYLISFIPWMFCGWHSFGSRLVPSSWSSSTLLIIYSFSKGIQMLCRIPKHLYSFSTSTSPCMPESLPPVPCLKTAESKSWFDRASLWWRLLVQLMWKNINIHTWLDRTLLLELDNTHNILLSNSLILDTYILWDVDVISIQKHNIMLI
jgi:hypothetical protein